jgi:hypothetical protein
MAEMLASAQSIRRTSIEALGSTALAPEVLVERLGAAGLDLGTDPESRVRAALVDDTRFSELYDERWFFVPAILEGTTWTTSVPTPPPADECLSADPDLAMLSWWALDQPIPIAGDPGGVLVSEELDDGLDALAGPPGWLAPFAGSTVSVTIVDEQVRLAVADRVPTPTDEQIEAVRAAFDRIALRDTLSGALLDEPDVDLAWAVLEPLLSEAVVADRVAFVAAPIPPVDDLLAAADLQRRGPTIADAEMDWAAYDRRSRRQRLATIHHLSDDDVDAVEILLGASYGVEGDVEEPFGPPDDEVVAATLLAVVLTEQPVARAFVGEHASRGTDPEVLADFARLLLERVADEVAVGARWVLARSLDLLGDATGAQAELELAVAADPDFEPAVRSLVGFRSDRGDAAGAFALLRTLDFDEDDPLLLEVGPYALARPRATVGRNAPCPCGSGRKYKVCHLGREQHPLIERGPWLYAKARRYLHDGRYRALGAELAATISQTSGRAGMMLRLLESEIVDDLALSEGGVFEAFLAERDALLPDDEALLAARWALVPRSVFEIEAVADDELALRDLRSGDHITVTNTNADDSSRPGMLLLGRPLPVDDTWRAFSGFVAVPDALRDVLLDALDGGEPFEIAELIGRAFAPPQMQNTDGDPLVFHELRYRVTDAERAAAAFVERGLHDDGDGHFTLVRDSANQRDTVILSLHLVDDELHVTANSDARAVEARALIAELLPDAVLEDDDERDLDELFDDLPADNTGSGGDLDVDDPAVAAALDEYIREQERRWIDEPIPALDGMTPRAAAVDPIGRVALERLLRTFDDRPLGPGGFDVDRIRALLDLDRPDG